MIRDFTYQRAETLDRALELLEKYKDDYKIICGGQSLLILMRQGLVAPANLIDIKNVQELSFIKFDPQKGLKIGANTSHNDIEKSGFIKEHYPILSEMEQNLASLQTRNWGTIGGNLAHGDPAGDPGPVLIALGATVDLADRKRERALPLEDFFIDYFETAIEDGEMLIAVQVPVVPPRTSVVYEKFNVIKNDQGIVSVAVFLTLEEKSPICKNVRIVLGAAASKPMRASEAEQLMEGKGLDEDLLDRVGKKAAEEADPVTDIHATESYRRQLIHVLTKRQIKNAWQKIEALGAEGENWR